VDAGMDNLEAVADILTAEELPAVEAAFSRMARPRFERLAGESGATAELLNARLQRFLLVVARDPELRAPVAAQAARRIGLNGEPDPDAVPQSEMQTVLRTTPTNSSTPTKLKTATYSSAVIRQSSSSTRAS
jgi:hypothetical protein